MHATSRIAQPETFLLIRNNAVGSMLCELTHEEIALASAQIDAEVAWGEAGKLPSSAIEELRIRREKILALLTKFGQLSFEVV